MIEVPYFMPASAPKRTPRVPHPSGYQLAKAKNQRMLHLINVISDRLMDSDAGYGPVMAIDDVQKMIAEWRNNG